MGNEETRPAAEVQPEEAGSPETGSSAAAGPAAEAQAPESPELAAAEPAGELPPEQLALEVRAGDAEAGAARLRALVEAAVYVTEEPLTARQIADALEAPLPEVQKALAELVEEYARAEHGIAIREVAEGYKMATKPEHHEAIRAFVKRLQKPLKLSMAALETLAVIAYKQPITAPEIMEIRGVQGAGVLKTLLERKLITTAGRKNVVGRPILYKTTKEFLVQFGLKSLKELPTLKEFEELARVALAEEEEPEGPASAEEASGQQAEAPSQAAPGEQAETPPGAGGELEEARQGTSEEQQRGDGEAPPDPKGPQSDAGEGPAEPAAGRRAAADE